MTMTTILSAQELLDARASFRQSVWRLLREKSVGTAASRNITAGRLLDDYTDKTGERPDPMLVTKLADYILGDMAEPGPTVLTDSQLKNRNGRECGNTDITE